MIAFKKDISLLIVPIVLLLIGCGKNICGVYVAHDNSNNYDTLKIYSNQKYTRIYRDYSDDLNHKIYVDTGTWNLKDNTICFLNWIDRSGREHFAGKGEMIFCTDIKTSLFNRKTEQLINGDLDYYYDKCR